MRRKRAVPAWDSAWAAGAGSLPAALVRIHAQLVKRSGRRTAAAWRNPAGRRSGERERNGRSKARARQNDT